MRNRSGNGRRRQRERTKTAGNDAGKQIAAPGAAPMPPKDGSATSLPAALATPVGSSDAAIAQAQKMLVDSDALLEGQGP